MIADEAMRRIDALVSHIWMVRTFVKHSEEAEEDDELMEVVRTLYDFCLSLGPAWTGQDAAAYLKMVQKKSAGLQDAVAKFAELQPQVSDHTNYKMAVRSLTTAVEEIGAVLSSARSD